MITVYGDGVKREIDGLLCGEEELKISNYYGNRYTPDDVKFLYSRLSNFGDGWADISQEDLASARQNYKNAFGLCQKLLVKHIKI